ncbi:hypothetical protein TcCL_Unassigned00942 [Trypanosoma cruzi]|nr:hypothetical protein TcCL_Unassigned00942 [Trypanosoma cruzi]
MKTKEKVLLRSQLGFLPFRSFSPSHQYNQQRYMGQHCGVILHLPNCALEKVERVDVLRQLRDHVWVQIVFLHYLSSVPRRTPLYGMRRGIPRSQSSPHVSSRKIRKLFVFLKCLA